MRREDDTPRLSLEKTKALSSAPMWSPALIRMAIRTPARVSSMSPWRSIGPSGKIVGVSQVNDHLLSVALLVNGRTVILVMTINGHGSLSGAWLRRPDRGSRGTKTWKRQAPTRA
jgi:hypothetical protein